MSPRYEDDFLTLLVGDARKVLADLPAKSVQTVVTSPPYFGLRQYLFDGAMVIRHDLDSQTRAMVEERLASAGILPTMIYDINAVPDDLRPYFEPAPQMGLEPTPEEYVANLVAVFREVRRVLRDDGTVWLNLGDSYWTDSPPRKSSSGAFSKTWDPANSAGNGGLRRTAARHGDMKNKDLIGIPWMVAFALRSDGWYLRSDIIWAKKNTMPESVTDRPTKSHEYIFLLTKSARYYYDAVAIAESTVGSKIGGSQLAALRGEDAKRSDAPAGTSMEGRGLRRLVPSSTRNARDVWTIATQPFAGAHFATFPPKLVEPCVLAGTSERGQCPECGSPWIRETVKRRTFESGSGRAGHIPIGKNGEGLQGGGETLDVRRGPVLHVETIGWRPSCVCGSDLLPDDLKIIKTPTGERVADDPSKMVGRAGFSRPRGTNEGQRPMTRYEQRAYAAQIKVSPNRAEMEYEAGPAFAHYIRTDYPNGARGIPQPLLDAWVSRGWLSRVEVPTPTPLEPVPQVVLDPFGGAGTTALVANRLGRRAVLVELNPDYAALTIKRLRPDASEEPVVDSPARDPNFPALYQVADARLGIADGPEEEAA